MPTLPASNAGGSWGSCRRRQSEVFKGVVKCSTNLNSDPVDMLTDCLRLGISTGVYGLTLTNLLNDVLLGEPELRQAPVGLRVIDPDYINIMITGHQHTIFVDLQEKLISPEAVAKAKAPVPKASSWWAAPAWARISSFAEATIPRCSTAMRENNYTSEAILETGAIDAVLSEFNCTLPGIEPICDALHIRQICLDDVAKKANAELMKFDFENREAQSWAIIDKIVEAYKERRGKVKLNLFPEHGNSNTLTGVSEGSLKEFSGRKLEAPHRPDRLRRYQGNCRGCGLLQPDGGRPRRADRGAYEGS